jgi:AraC-like DNA-binding protein
MTLAPPSLLYLWPKRTLYFGAVYEPRELSQAAATLLVSLGEPIRFVAKGMSAPVASNSILLQAGVRVWADSGNAMIANCYLDALGVDYHNLSALMTHQKGGAAWQLKDEAQYIKVFRSIYDQQQGSEDTWQVLDHLLMNNDLSAAYPVDARVEEVLERIRRTVDDNLSVEELADAVCLSVPRLVEVFKKQTGIPIRRYRLWHRLYVTALRMGCGENLTEAALAAGFTDSAHCSHTFRAMLGMPPSQIFSPTNKMRIVTPQTHRDAPSMACDVA